MTRKRRWLLVALVCLAALAWDLSRPAPRQLSAKVLLLGIDLYQATLSKALGSFGASCRFTPSCSHYAEGAIHKHGALEGSRRAAVRVLRCGPWTPAGTHDPP